MLGDNQRGISITSIPHPLPELHDPVLEDIQAIHVVQCVQHPVIGSDTRRDPGPPTGIRVCRTTGLPQNESMDVPGIRRQRFAVECGVGIEHDVQVFHAQRCWLHNAADSRAGGGVVHFDETVGIVISLSVLLRQHVILVDAIGLVADDPQGPWIGSNPVR